MTLVGTALNSGKKLKNLCLSANVPHKTSNLAIACCCLAEDKEMDKSEKRSCKACKAVVFANLICKFVTFSSPFSLLQGTVTRFCACAAS